MPSPDGMMAPAAGRPPHRPPAAAGRRRVEMAGRAVRWCFFSPGFRTLDVLRGDSRMSGGAEAQIAHLAAALAAAGDGVSLIYGDGGCRAAPSREAGILCLDAAPSWRRPASLAAFARTLRGLAPRIVYARLPSDFLWLIPILSCRAARFVYAIAHDDHCRPWSAYDRRRWFHAPLHALGLAGADVIAVQHAGQRERLPCRSRSRVAHVPNLVRAFRAAPRPFAKAAIDAIWIAQIRPEKRLDRFLDLAAACPDLRCAVVGGFDPTLSEAERDHLSRRLRALPNVKHLGPRRADQVQALLEASKVLVNTSSAEGFPNTMLEAWSRGVPVLSLGVDPGGVIVREGLGAVAPTDGEALRALAELTRKPSANIEAGALGLAYVARRHDFAAVREALRAAVEPMPSVLSLLQPLETRHEG